MRFIMRSLIIRLLVSFPLIFAVNAVQAQVQKGDNLLGFSSSVSTQSSSPSSINVTVLLSYERYLTRKLALGAGPFVSMITARGYMMGIYGGNVFANYGFITGDGKFYPYVGILGSVSQSVSTQDTNFQTTQSSDADKRIGDSGNSTVSFYGAGAKVGSKFFVTERINIDLNVNYSTNISSVVNGEVVKYGEGGIVQIFAGIGVILGKRSGI